LGIASGLKIQSGGTATSLAGEQNPIQMIVELVTSADYDAARNRLLDDSRSRTGKNVIGLLARSNPDLDDFANEIYRSQRIAELHRNEPDQEIRDYCAAQLDRAAKLAAQLKSKIKQTFNLRRGPLVEEI
jgi:hypothetical protein